jgi:hypothetical protein
MNTYSIRRCCFSKINNTFCATIVGYETGHGFRHVVCATKIQSAVFSRSSRSCTRAEATKAVHGGGLGDGNHPASIRNLVGTVSARSLSREAGVPTGLVSTYESSGTGILLVDWTCLGGNSNNNTSTPPLPAILVPVIARLILPQQYLLQHSCKSEPKGMSSDAEEQEDRMQTVHKASGSLNQSDDEQQQQLDSDDDRSGWHRPKASYGTTSSDKFDSNNAKTENNMLECAFNGSITWR